MPGAMTAPRKIAETILREVPMTPAQRDAMMRCIAGWEASVATLRDREAHIRAVLETTVEGIITIGIDGVIRTFNPAAERIFGYAASEAVGANVSMLMPTPHREKHDRYIARYIETGQSHIIGVGREVPGRRKNGEIFPLELSVSEVRAGSERTFTGVVRDVSERRHMDRALQDERNFVNAILDTAGALILVLDREGRIVRLNRACESTTGYAQEEIRGRILWETLAPDAARDAERDAFFQVLDSGSRTAHEGSVLRKDGQCRLVAWSSSPLPGPAGDVAYVVCTGIDITERRRAQEALVSIGEEVRREIGRELHDALGQQLTGLSLLTKTLELRLADAALSEREQAAEITALSRNAVSEVRRLAHGLYPVELERLGLEAALAELAESHTTRRPGLHCRFERPPHPATGERTIDLHLYRIAQEAVTNAVKHSGATEIVIALSGDSTSYQLTVRDNGVGFDVRIPEGRAMGLAIMRYRAEMIGAGLAVESVPGQGTRVICRIRAGRQAPEQAGSR
jgi:PAS domain S-box-containing protein